MTTLRLALSELKRMTRGTMPKLALIAITCVPLLYGALYLYANWNPQGNLNRVTAAVVNLDAGADKDGEFTTVGDEVVESVKEDGTFSWAQLDTQQEAEDAVASGEYAFALILPEDFTAALVSPADLKKADQANIELLTNDANNFMVSNFAKTLATEVQSSVSTQVGTETAASMIAGFVDIHDSMNTAAQGAEELYDGTMTLGDGVLTLADGTTRLVDGSSELADGTTTLKDGTSSLNSGLNALVGGEKKLVDGTNTLVAGADKLSTGAGDLSDGLDTLKSKTAKLPASVSALNDGAQSAKDAADQLADGSQQVADGNDQLVTTAGEAMSVIDQLQTDAESRLANVESTTSTYLDALVSDGTLSAEQAKSIGAKVSATVADEQLSATVKAKAEEINTQLSTVQEQLKTLAAGANQVADGNQKLATGLGTLAEGTATLNSAVPALTDGIASAADGGSQVADGAASLSAGARTLATGQQSAYDGASQAASGSQKLDDGASALVDGSDALHGGLVKLSGGVADLSDGAGKLQSGSDELASGLSDGVSQVPDPDAATSDQLANVIGDPVNVQRSSQAKANEYGEGLAPFFMTLATFIGVLILTQVMRPITKRALASNASNWKIAIGGWLPFAGIALIQTSILYAVVLFGLKLSTPHPWMTWGLFLLAALCFSAITQGIFALLGTAGKFMVLVLMVLQLVTSGGTFPWETLPEPLQFLHQVLPMSQVVIGMRHLMYGAQLGMLSNIVLSLIIWTVVGLALSFLAVRAHKTWSLKTLQPELGE